MPLTDRKQVSPEPLLPSKRSECEHKRTMKKNITTRARAGGKGVYKKRGVEWMRKLGRRSAAKRKKALKLLEAAEKTKK